MTIMKFCPQCGTKLDSDARFCVSCGMQQPQRTAEEELPIAPVEAEAIPDVTVTEENETPVPKKRLKDILFGARGRSAKKQTRASKARRS